MHPATRYGQPRTADGFRPVCPHDAAGSAGAGRWHWLETCAPLPPFPDGPVARRLTACWQRSGLWPGWYSSARHYETYRPPSDADRPLPQPDLGTGWTLPPGAPNLLPPAARAE